MGFYAKKTKAFFASSSLRLCPKKGHSSNKKSILAEIALKTSEVKKDFDSSVQDFIKIAMLVKKATFMPMFSLLCSFEVLVLICSSYTF